MNMTMYNLGKFVGLLFGMGAGLLITLFVFRLLRGKGQWGLSSKYDERQKEARGTAYMVGFWTLVVYLLLWFLLEECHFTLFSTPIMLVIGMTLSLCVQTSISLWKDAYYGLNDNPKKFFLYLVFIEFLDALLLFSEVQRGITEYSNLPWLLAGAVFGGLSVFLTMALKMLIRSREEKVE